jgi:hypothetical protein
MALWEMQGHCLLRPAGLLDMPCIIIELGSLVDLKAELLIPDFESFTQ